jgi:hypothetical protein
MHTDLWFLKKIEQEGPTPCQKFECPRRQECAEQLLACEAFAHYVETGDALTPRGTVGRVNGKAGWQVVGPINNTAEWYRRVFEETV